MKMRLNPKKLHKIEELNAAKLAFHSVFKSADIIDCPFTDNIEKIAIIFYHQYALNEKWYSAVAAAAKVLDEDEAYISEVELYLAKRQFEAQTTAYKIDGDPLNISPKLERFYHQGFEKYDHWLVNLNYYPYRIVNPLIENALYSVKGTWGIIFSEIGFAIVGASTSFFRILEKEMPKLSQENNEFLSYMKTQIDKYPDTAPFIKEWLPSLLSKIYGPNDARAMLIIAGLNSLL